MPTKTNNFVGAPLPPIKAPPVRYSPTEAERREAQQKTKLNEADITILAAMAAEITPFLYQKRVIIKRVDVAEDIFKEIKDIARVEGVHTQTVVHDLIARGLAAYRANPKLMRPSLRLTGKIPPLPTPKQIVPQAPRLGDE